MQCPYCDREMEKGYIHQNTFQYPLQWEPAKRDPGIWVSTKRNVKLTALFKGGYVTAYRCELCKKIIIDENTLEV